MDDRSYSDLFAQVGRYDARWENLPVFGRAAGTMQVVRATDLLVPDIVMHICCDALEYLFESKAVLGLGGRLAPLVLFWWLRQMADEDPAAMVIVWATPRSVQLLRKGEKESEVRAEPKVIKLIEGNPQPNLILHDRLTPIISPRSLIGRHADPFRYFKVAGRHATPYSVETVETAIQSGRKMFKARQTLFTVANPSPENLARLHRGLAPASEVPRRTAPDGTTLTIELPTIMFHRITPRPNGKDNFDDTRFGINFAPGGEHICGLSSKTSDFRTFLQLFPSEFETTLQCALRPR